MQIRTHLLVGYSLFALVVFLWTPSFAAPIRALSGMHRSDLIGGFTGPGGGHRGYNPGRLGTTLHQPEHRRHYKTYGYGHHPKRPGGFRQPHFYSYTPYVGYYCPDPYHYHQGYRGAHAHRAPRYRDYYGRHGYAVWTPLPPPRVIITTPFYCQVCGIGFAGEQLFVSHVHKIHDVPYDDVGAACISVGERVVFEGY